MSGFGVTANVDPETYLRLACERLLLFEDRQRGPHGGGGLAIAGRALIASGQLDEDRVRGVLDEYVFAFGLRGHGGWWHVQRMDRDESKGQRLTAQRVVVCDLMFGDAKAPTTLERVVFADDATRFDLSGIGPSSQRLPPVFRKRMMLRGGLPHGQVLTVSDDAGTTTSASSSGGGSSGRTWNAHFRTDAPLSAETAWIEIDGARINLPERRPSPAVRTEPVEAVDPVRAMLYGEILGSGRMHGDEGSVEIAIETLVATGALKGDDPLVVEVEAIAKVFEKGGPAPNLPPPWGALLRRIPKSDGPVGKLAIGAVVDSIEGISIRFDALTSEEGFFSVALAVSPGWPLQMHFPGFRLDRSPIAFWAEDDRKNVYFLVPEGGGGSGNLAEGTINSIAPLDPKASELRLLPTASHERAVVTLSLSDLGGTL